MSSTSEGFVRTVDGVRIAYRDHGRSGRGLVLLHGGEANVVAMDPYAERLGSGRRVVALDLRGCGHSGDARRYGLQSMVLDVEAVVRALDLGPVDLLGHSLGGMVAAVYGIGHPESAIVNIDGFPPGSLTVGDAAARARWERWGRDAVANVLRILERPEYGDRHWRDAQLTEFRDFVVGTGVPHPNATALAERNFVDAGEGRYRRRPTRAVADGMLVDFDLDVLRAHRAGRGPALIIRCTGWAPPELDAELDDLVAKRDGVVEVVRLPIAHLSPTWEALDEIAGLAERFLRTQSAQRARRRVRSGAVPPDRPRVRAGRTG